MDAPNSIEEINVKNYMRVRTARLVVDGNTIKITGENEAGKTSFVTAIQDIFGGKDSAPAMPIRKGATEATVMVRVCSDGKRLKAELTHTKGGRRLVVRDEDDKAQSSPQAIMDRFWSETSFDPSIFLISKPQEQTKMLMRLANLDFAKLDAERAEKFLLRTNVNREVDRLKTVAAMKPNYPDAPKAEQSAGDIIAEVSKANAHNAALTTLQQTESDLADSADTFENRINGFNVDIRELEAEIARIQEKLKVRKANLADVTASLTTTKTEWEKAKKAVAEFVAVDVAPLQAKLAAVEETNRKVRGNVDKTNAVAAAQAKQVESDKLTERITAIDDDKAEQLRNAKFPIDGMSIDGDDVTIAGIPLAQQSDMRRLAIGVEMAAVMNPNKPLMLVRHGNLFTPQNFHILQEIAEKRKLTCIVEIPGTNIAGSKLVFEDGIGVAPAPEAQATIPGT